MDKPVNPWSVPVSLEEIPETGLHREIEAPEEARAAIAELAGLYALPQLKALFDLAPRGGGIAISGRVQARVGQACVVTLDPIENTLDEPIDLLFAPEGAAVSSDVKEEPPEVLTDDRLDLGALATEFLLLAIDPYPRKPGVEFSQPKAEYDRGNPFSVLAKLKKRFDGAQS